MQKAETRGAGTTQITVSLLLGGLLALGVEILVLLLGSVAVSKGILQDDAAAQVSAAACVLGCLIGGWFACGRVPARRLLAGIAAGGVCFLLILVVGLLMGDGFTFGTQGVIELAACLCGGGAAGLLCRKKKKGKRTARRTKK